MTRTYNSYSVKGRGLDYFKIEGGPFSSPMTMGWHIVDDKTGLTSAVSCDESLCNRLNSLEVIARAFEDRDLYHLISDKLHDGGYLKMLDEEWEEFRQAVKDILNG